MLDSGPGRAVGWMVTDRLSAITRAGRARRARRVVAARLSAITRMGRARRVGVAARLLR